MNKTKKCSNCKQEKELNEFHRNRARSDGIDNTCKKCWTDIRKSPKAKEYAKKYKEENREKLASNFKKHRLKYKMKKYKASLIEYEKTLKHQDNSCAICRTVDEKLLIDHDHASGRFRGLLCLKCNLMLGYAKDNIMILTNAVNYLKSHPSGAFIKDMTDDKDNYNLPNTVQSTTD